MLHPHTKFSHALRLTKAPLKSNEKTHRNQIKHPDRHKRLLSLTQIIKITLSKRISADRDHTILSGQTERLGHRYYGLVEIFGVCTRGRGNGVQV